MEGGGRAWGGGGVTSTRSRTGHLSQSTVVSQALLQLVVALLLPIQSYTGNIGQFPTWVKLGSNLGNNNSQLLKLGFSWGKVGFYFES